MGGGRDGWMNGGRDVGQASPSGGWAAGAHAGWPEQRKARGSSVQGPT